MRKFKCVVLFFAVAIWLGIPSVAQKPQNHGSQILFVCEHGNVKSFMAMSYFNRLAEQRGIRFRAIARGTSPNSGEVPPAIADGLKADGFEVEGFHPTALSRPDLDSSHKVITIGVNLPDEFRMDGNVLEAWNDVPAATVDFNATRDSLKKHVTKLLDQLESVP